MKPEAHPPAGPPAMTPWERSCLCAALMAADPAGLGGLVLRARAGPVRDRWLAHFRDLLGSDVALRKVPAGTGADRLLGGIDLTATLTAGRPVAQTGLMAEADGGVLLLAMAERLPEDSAAHIAGALDLGAVVLERDGLALRSATRFGVIAIDEGIDEDEQVPLILRERLGLHADLTDLGMRDMGEPQYGPDDIKAARSRLAEGTGEDETAILEALCQVALALGVASLRAPYLALRAARAIAALDGRTVLEERDAMLAAGLVLGPRATILPSTEPEESAAEDDAPEPEAEDAGDPPPPEDSADQSDPNADEENAQPLEDVVLDAALAALPDDLLARLKLGAPPRGPSSEGGRAGAVGQAKRRGRPAGVRKGALDSGRLHVLETLRAAAPWQEVRRRVVANEPANGGTKARKPRRIEVRSDDFRIKRFKQKTETVAIFVVDASGSAALHRLAEAKGAVELLLADCYVRRDQVALIAFRGEDAELLLPPTRSLVRAKRSLAGLPGGGGTPLAAGLDAARLLVEAVRRKGLTPVVVVLTDGRGNIARDGARDRRKAAEDATDAARALCMLGATTLMIDTAPRRHPDTEELARVMGARYAALPHARAEAVSALAQSVIVSG